MEVLEMISYQNYGVPQFQQNQNYPYQGRTENLYSPYGYLGQNQQQNIQQPQNCRIIGKLVRDVSEALPNDVPMDGSLAFFPRQDMAEIYAKQWNADGTIKTVIYRPVMDNAVNSQGNNQNQQITIPDDVTQAFMDRFDELSNKMEQLENSLTKSSTNVRKTSTKKDGDLND